MGYTQDVELRQEHKKKKSDKNTSILLYVVQYINPAIGWHFTSRPEICLWKWLLDGLLSRVIMKWRREGSEIRWKVVTLDEDGCGSCLR